VEKLEIIESWILVEAGLNPRIYMDLMDLIGFNPGAQAPEPIS
jgi:hypothetical protein